LTNSTGIYEPDHGNSLSSLRADCEKCFGLCCVALYFFASEGFPGNKEAGQPCAYLKDNFSCLIYKNLRERGLKGCTAFDCFGAGQKVSQVSFKGLSWRKNQESAAQMFEVFLIMRQLHELLWYLQTALAFKPARPMYNEVVSIFDNTQQLTHLEPQALLELDVEAHRKAVDLVLLKTSELVRSEYCRGEKTHPASKILRPGADLAAKDLRRSDLKGENLRGVCLIAADLNGVDLSGADLIGADLRDADIRGADLSNCIFITQAQINTAKGDINTKLPSSLARPAHWEI